MSNSDQIRQLQTQIDELTERRDRDAKLIRVLSNGQAYFLHTLTAPGLADVIRERIEQIRVHGYSANHDADHACDELAAFAAVYAMPEACRDWDTRSSGYGNNLLEALTPEDWTPKFGSRRSDLVKAAALLLAEIDRLDAMEKEHDSTH
ncbi:hypothetical protein [Halopseudomonas aestusnigri]|uniref:Uncharacterized protein n=1 Tax=Halopseudomonas aestusnigri TaxID=857252 RepID=A0AAQ1GAA8_9GAMM|nr:hypothetical protein [Halopseudomonas aestusnigri]OWL84603.1 hypothetical protein B7O88_16280 [Halopseudomonas aestusnigri]SEG69898.1 hypothetical protein SAMN05216586_11634 [Halopseudomonas aestusnigri]